MCATMNQSEDKKMMTLDEHHVMILLGDIGNKLREIIGDGPQSEFDWQEAVHHIHGLQHMVMSQAAARLYPVRYRLLGGKDR